MEKFKNFCMEGNMNTRFVPYLVSHSTVFFKVHAEKTNPIHFLLVLAYSANEEDYRQLLCFVGHITLNFSVTFQMQKVE